MSPPAPCPVRPTLVAFVLLLLAVAPGDAGAAPGDSDAAAARRLNFVVFLTDDQRFDTLWAMPLLQSALAARGVTFEQAFVTTPQCCPFRASFLAGGYLANDTGVLENVAPNGGEGNFNDATTLATRLQQRGYATALIGKYMNDYELVAPYIPPGWELFHGVLGSGVIPPSVYAVGSSSPDAPGTGVLTPPIAEYHTDYLRDRALEFIDAQRSPHPFFLYLAFGAPHAPAAPAPADATSFPDYLYRERAYAEPDISDKPDRIAQAASRFPKLVVAEDELHRNQLRALQSVDRAVAAIVERVDQRRMLDDTVFVFASDNGLLWGEHHLTGKGEAYEESIRVPLIVAAPGVAPRTDDRLVAVNLDLAATLADFAGMPPVGDGMSLVPLLSDPALPGRAETLLEQSLPNRVWAGLRVRDDGGDWKYVEDSNGDRELYDLAADPYEEENRIADPSQQDRVALYAARLATQRRLAITTAVPSGFLQGVPYASALETWGGVPPLEWSIEAGALPEGLSLDASTGVVSGVPTSATPSSARFRVRDASIGAHSGAPRTHVKWLQFLPALCSNGVDDDGDTLVDLADPGCSGPGDVTEWSPTLECTDGVDNDGDSKIDLLDPDCRVAPFNREKRNSTCGVGVELLGLGLLPLLRRRAVSRACAPSPTRRAA